MRNKKSLSDRIGELEHAITPSKRKLVWWCDDDALDLSEFLAREQEQAGKDVQLIVAIGVSGQWVERPGKPNVWARPPRAAARYERWGSYAPDTPHPQKAVFAQYEGKEDI